jgi:hypothetical protein
VPYAYRCPDCRTTSNLHDPDCRYDGTPWTEIERAYTDVLAVLSAGATPRRNVREAVESWDRLRRDALGRLIQEQRVRETPGGALELLSPAEFREAVSAPDREPLKTIYEKGSVPGSHDNAVFALIAFYEMVGLSWEESRERVLEWLHESGTWDRGGFEEDSPEELVDSKRHVYEQGYGWKEKARAAKGVIDRRLGE